MTQMRGLDIGGEETGRGESRWGGGMRPSVFRLVLGGTQHADTLAKSHTDINNADTQTYVYLFISS